MNTETQKADKPRKSMRVQSLIFDKDKFSRDAAKKWASDHNFKSADVDETGQSYRLRQMDPGKFSTMRTISMTEGVNAVVAKSSGKVLSTPEIVLKMIAGSVTPTPKGIIDKLGMQAGGNIGGTVRDGSNDEKFNVGSLVFNVNRAKQMSNGKPNDEIEVSPHWSDLIYVDNEAAMRSTSDNPVLVAQIPTTAGNLPLLIDGHHRMRKAVVEGKKTLPAYVFSPESSVDLIDTHPDILNCLRSNLVKTGPLAPIAKMFATIMKSLQPTRSDVHVNSPLGSDDDEGGLFKSDDETTMESAGLVTFPEDVEGSNCANCKYVNGDHCDNPKLDFDLKDGAERMCCNYWDHDGTEGFVTKDEDVAPGGAGGKDYWLESVFEDIEPSEPGSEPEPGPDDEEMAKSAFEPNENMGIHSMQELVSGMDHEFEKDPNLSSDMAKEKALANLDVDPEHYKKIRMAHFGENFGHVGKDATALQDGVSLHIGSADRAKHHIGFDNEDVEDHGTIQHDLNEPIPLADGVAKNVLITRKFDDLTDNPKAMMSDVVRLLMPGGQFVYEGPNQVYNYPPELASHGEPEVVDKDSGITRHEFTRIVRPDAAAANDADPRVGVPTFDQMSTDELMAMDALGYYFSDATTSGRGNRLHGYPSQGALTDPNDEVTDATKDAYFSKDDLTTEGRKNLSDSDFALPGRKYPIHDLAHARNALARVAQHGSPEEQKKVKAKVYAKYPALAERSRNKSDVEKLLKSGGVIPICKADKMKQILYCVVYEPNEVDTQEDWMTADEIEKSAHSYLVNSRVIGKNHSKAINADLVESFIAPQDLEYSGGPYGDQIVRKGSWVIGVKVKDPDEWQKVLDGDYSGVSVGGFGVRD